MKIEIAHDALAKRVFEKASSDDKMRLKAKGFIEERYNDFINPKRRVLLRVSDLNYIEPYLKSLEQDLTPEVAEFIKRSQNRRFWVRLSAALVILALFGVLVGTLIKVNATKNNFQALNYELATAEKRIGAQNDSLKNVIDTNHKLMISLGITDKNLQKTKDSLYRANEKRDSLAKELEASNIKLIAQNKELDRLNRELNTKNKELNSKKQKAENEVVALNNEKNNLTKAQNLCQKAYDYQKKGDKESAFRAAAEAWQLDPNSTIAVDILRKINSEITGSPNWSVPPKKIIDDHAKRFKFKPR